MTTLSIRLTDELGKQLAEEARTENKARSEVVREAIKEFIARRERERFMQEFLRAAKAALADPEVVAEMRQIEEDFFPTDNEALDLAEGRKPGEPWPEEKGERWWK